MKDRIYEAGWLCAALLAALAASTLATLAGAAAPPSPTPQPPTYCHLHVHRHQYRASTDERPSTGAPSASLQGPPRLPTPTLMPTKMPAKATMAAGTANR